MKRRDLAYYLLLNIFVSACVTSAILFWYDRNYRAETQPAVQQVSSGDAIPTADLQTDIPIKISSVVGAGTVNAEIAVVKFEGEGQLNLAGWQLRDEDGNTFSFPQLTLYQNGAVQVHTVSGTDTVIDLYWGLQDPVWQAGEEARLFDSQGNLRAVYPVP
ncbi:MAG: lamin tail domain-containing protein [Chloroflexota bacterium]